MLAVNDSLTNVEMLFASAHCHSPLHSYSNIFFLLSSRFSNAESIIKIAIYMLLCCLKSNYNANVRRMESVLRERRIKLSSTTDE
jgi:hypothetical protein